MITNSELKEKNTRSTEMLKIKKITSISVYFHVTTENA